MTAASRTPIRAAVAGYGLSGSVFHAPFLAANQEFSLDVIATSDAGRRQSAAERYPGVKLVDRPDDILALAGELDLIVLGTPRQATTRWRKPRWKPGSTSS